MIRFNSYVKEGRQNFNKTMGSWDRTESCHLLKTIPYSKKTKMIDVKQAIVHLK